MSEETLSALLDGECSEAELEKLLDSLDKTPELKARWSRLCQAREAGRGVHIRAAHVDFASRVLAAIDTDRPEGRVVPIRAAAAPRRSWRPLVSLAAAASVLVGVALLLWQQPAGQPVAPEAIAVAPPSFVARTEPRDVAGFQDAVVREGVNEGGLRWANLDRESAQQLDRYLIDYSSYRSAQGMGGMGYARYAARTEAEPADGRR